MKHFVITTITLFLVSVNMNAQTIDIPDSTFKSYLINNPFININSDEEIQLDEALTFNGFIDINGIGISNLSGIEYFHSLTALRCQNNSLTFLDLSSNSALKTLDCENNMIVFLKLPEISHLTYLNFNNNDLTEIDFISSTQLVYLFGRNNELVHINISTCPNITSFSFGSNNLSSANISNENNMNFEHFNLGDNTDLICIQVDNTLWSETNWVTPLFIKGAVANYSESCYSDLIDISTQKLKIYPNPVRDQIQIDLNDFCAEILELNIIDDQGKRSQLNLYDSHSIYINHLTQGTYILEFKTQSGLIYERFTKL